MSHVDLINFVARGHRCVPNRQPFLLEPCMHVTRVFVVSR